MTENFMSYPQDEAEPLTVVFPINIGLHYYFHQIVTEIVIIKLK